MFKNAFLVFLVIMTVAPPSVRYSHAYAGEEADDDAKDDIKVIEGKKKNLTLSLGMSRTLEFPFELGPDLPDGSECL